MIEKLVLEFIHNHDPMSKEIVLEKLSQVVQEEDVDIVLKTLESIKDITSLEYAMVINAIAKPGRKKLDKIILKRLRESEDADAIDELIEASKKLSKSIHP